MDKIKSAAEAAGKVAGKAAAETAAEAAGKAAAVSTAAIVAVFLFFAPFTLQSAHAQNYPLLTPGFAEEEALEAEREAEKSRTTAITMYWELPAQRVAEHPAQIKAGEEITLTLRARNWVSQAPGSAFFMPSVPQGVILTPLGLSAEERAKGIAVKFKIIPLAAGEVVLPARTLKYENLQFNIPALNIRVNNRKN